MDGGGIWLPQGRETGWGCGSWGRAAEAKAAYEQAVELAPTDAERRYLTGRLEEL